MRPFDLGRAAGPFPIGPTSGWIWVYGNGRWHLHGGYTGSGDWQPRPQQGIPLERQEEIARALPRVFWPPPAPLPARDDAGAWYDVTDGKLHPQDTTVLRNRWIACDGHRFLQLMGSVLP